MIIVISYAFPSIAVTPDQFRVYGLSAFDKDQAKMLRNWLSQGVNATRATLGVYPTPLNLYLYPRKSNQPVPWAYTQRDEKGSVHFYVDPRFGFKKFVNDWTVYHELAHMAIPYLGSDYRWLSEGFASFMQYQIMQNGGALIGTLDERYASKINPHLRWFNSDLTAAAIARRLMNNQQYPEAYWGSAYFFILADLQLQKRHAMTLTELINRYQDCCRLNDSNLNDLVASLDGMIEDNLFAHLLARYESAHAREIYPQSLELQTTHSERKLHVE